MPKVPYPILKWRDAKEKEWAFRALCALGFVREEGSIDQQWANLSHSERFDGLSVDVDRIDGTYHYLIRFTKTSNGIRTLVNSGPHLISYIKRHGLAPKRDV